MTTTHRDITVTVDLPIRYRAVMSGGNVVVLETYFKENYYPINSLPEEARLKIFNAIIEAVRIEDFEKGRALEDFDQIMGAPQFPELNKL